MRLGEVIRKWRVMNELDLRTVASEIGISAATLMRLEQGRTPDGDTLAKVLAWLFAPTALKSAAKQEGVERG